MRWLDWYTKSVTIIMWEELANTMVDPKYKTMADKAAKWASTREGQAAAKRAVKDARETVQAMREAQKIDLTKSCKFVL